MTWYPCYNTSNRRKPWKPGEIIRYDYGPSALMRVECVRYMGKDRRGIGCAYRYYGRQMFGDLMGRYHGQIHGTATPEEVEAFNTVRNKMDIERDLYAGMTFDEWYACDPRPECRS